MVRKRQPDTWRSRVTLHGLRPGVMFDRYTGENNAKIANHDKMYLLEDGTVYLPSINLMSALSAINTRSFVKALYDPRKYKEKAAALLGHVSISPTEIVLTRDNRPIKWMGEFDEGPDGPSGIVLHKSVARLPNGIPNPKERPLILAPWEIEFDIEMFENRWVSPPELQKLIEEGSMLVGYGTFRGVYGKATVEWD